jgi:cytochrome oxidase Cu insertion factor (SCO1/SenC/PrrC family)
MSRLAAIAFIALAIAGPALAQQPPAPRPGSGQATPTVVNVQALGPQVGARIPDFTLVDQSGTPRTLRSLMGSKGLMLVLFRSADW